MAQSEAPSAASSASSRAKRALGSQCAEIVEKGPVVINGLVFVRIRRCPLCTLTNTDANPIKSGPLGETEHMMWHQGSSSNPMGRIHRVCWIVFTTGGFAHEHNGDLDAYLAVRKADNGKVEEWQGAWDELIKVGHTLPARLGKVIQKGLSDKLLTARKVKVEAFKKTQSRVKGSYRAVLKTKFEKQHPGRLQRQGLTTKWITAEGRRVEVVMVRRLPQDEWDVDFEEVQGAAQIEDLDDGELNLRASQAASKFQGVAAKTVMSKSEVDNAVLASDDEEDDASRAEEGDSPIDVDSAEEEVVADNLGWVTSCLLDGDLGDSNPRPAKGGKPVAASPATKQSAASAASQGTPKKAAKPATPSKSGAGAAPRLALPSAGVSPPASSAGSAEDSTRRKFRGKSVEDILTPHGWAEINASFDAVTSKMQEGPFTSMLHGGALETYASEAAALKKQAVSLQKALVNLDIKVKKWKDTPEAVLKALSSHRGRSKALVDALTAFPGVPKAQDSEKMEVARAGLKSEHMQIPVAFNVLFFKEKACELIRFRHIDEYAVHIQVGGAGFIQQDMFADTDGLQDMLVDVSADAVKVLLQDCIVAQDAEVQNFEVIGELAYKVLQAPHGLPADAGRGLQLVVDAFGGDPATAALARDRALADLLAMHEAPSDSGILVPMLREPTAKAVLTSLALRYKGSKPVQDLAAALLRHIDAMSGKLYTETDKQLFYDDFFSMVEQYHSMEDKQDKQAVAHISRIFKTFDLKADSGLKSIGKELESAIVALCRQADGALAALDARGRIKGAAESIGDIARRNHLDARELTLRLQTLGSDEKVMEPVCNLERMKSSTGFFVKAEELIGQATQVCADLAEFQAQHTTEAMAALLKSVMSLKAKAEASHASGELRPHLSHLEGACGLRGSCKKAYDDALTEFKVNLSMLAAFAIDTRSGGPSTIDEAGAKELVAQITDNSFKLKQQASYSDSPQHDRAAIGLMQKIMPACKHAEQLMRLKEDPKTNISNDISGSLAAVLDDLNLSKPALLWCLGEQQADLLVQTVKEFAELLKPVQETEIAETMNALKSQVKKLTAFMPPADIGDDDLLGQYTSAKMEKIRKQRSSALAACNDADQVHTKFGLEKPEELIAGRAQVELARKQTIKYGFLCLTKSSDAKAENEQGTSIRNNLKTVWDTHCTDDALCEFLGAGLVASVKDLVAVHVAAVKKTSASPEVVTAAAKSDSKRSVGGKSAPAGNRAKRAKQ